MKILIFIITYKASYRVEKIIREMPLKYLKKHNYKYLLQTIVQMMIQKIYI